MPGKTPSDDVSPLQPKAAEPENGGVATVDEAGGPAGDPSADSRDLQLMAVLAELVRERGRPSAAELLDLDPRTVASALKRGTLSRRMRTALERVGGVEGGPAGEALEPTSALEERLEGVERELLATRDLARDQGRSLKRQHAEDLQQLERRLARLESLVEHRGRELASSEDTEPVVGGPALRPQSAASLPPRKYSELVTQEPAPDDEQVYGAAWPLVDEWRRLWREHERPGRGLTWLEREVRILELEVAMLEEHELTLPPATYPQRGLELRGHLRWRLRALANRRRARRWARVRRGLGRALVLGLLLGVAVSMVLVNGGA